MYFFSRLYHTPITIPNIAEIATPNIAEIVTPDDILDMEWETVSIVDEKQEEQHAILYDESINTIEKEIEKEIETEIETETEIEIEKETETKKEAQEIVSIPSEEKNNSPKDTTISYQYTSFAIPPLTIPNENTDEKQVQHVPNTSPYNDQPVFYATTLSWTPIACKKEDDIESDFSNLFTEMIDFLFGPDVIEKIKEHHAEKPITV